MLVVIFAVLEQGTLLDEMRLEIISLRASPRQRWLSHQVLSYFRDKIWAPVFVFALFVMFRLNTFNHLTSG